ncbi:hypothetical protein [Pseudomonas sp. 65/3-MNA-CIBAN-0223]|uniref:hypothetical protein n=1 Tax=Pseudomonas sp. 65/3-MNA-CIBAN-0223 TaxID=3140476 RepID=UPI003321A6DE
MQSSGLSGPAQGPLSRKLDELHAADKVSKKNLGKLDKIVGELDNTKNNPALMNAIKSMGKSTGDLKGLFISLRVKLVDQNSRMFDKKQGQLISIEEKIIPIAKKVDEKNIRLRMRSIDAEIDDKEGEVERLDGKNRRNAERKAPLEKKIEWAKASDSDLESIRNNLRKKTAKLIANVQKPHEKKISTIDRQIQSLKNSKDLALEHASRNGVAVSQRLDWAVEGKIYDHTNTGFGTETWSSYIQRDEFVIKTFGSVKKEGDGKYPQYIKVPNAAGEEWKRLVKDFLDSPAKLEKLQLDKDKLEKDHRQLVELMTSEAESPDNKISEQEITEINNSISTFKKEDENREKKIKEFKDSISKLKQERTRLVEEFMFLQRMSPAS